MCTQLCVVLGTVRYSGVLALTVQSVPPYIMTIFGSMPSSTSIFNILIELDALRKP